MRGRMYRIVVVLWAFLTCPVLALSDENLTEVRVQLKWFHQFQFAGYYAALDKGYFRDAGLDVTIIEGGPHINPTDQVLAGRAEFGIGTSGLLVSRSRGKPVVAVAAVFQHSPYILIVRDDPEIRTVHDLAGRSIMVEPYSEELIAYLAHAGLDPGRVNLIEHSGDPFDIYTDMAVGMTAYTTTEPYLLQQAVKPYRVFDPKVAGIDFYGDTLFTTNEYAELNNVTVAAFRDAVIRGWRYALRNQDEIIDLIRRDYSTEHTHDYLRYEADDIRRLLIPDLIEIGYMNPERWQHIANEFTAAGLMEKDVDIDSFLFSPEEIPDWKWLLNVLLISIAVIIVITAVLAKFYTLNRSLQAEILRRMALEKELQKRAITDFGTAVLNRRGFLEVLEKEFARADRDGSVLSLLELDLDYFKNINDRYGHAAGDKALSFVASICRDAVRSIDSIGRVGGEEFMIVLPAAGIEDARAVAERILSTLEATPLRLAGGQEITITASIGVAERLGDEDPSALMSRADQAMYEAKELGRNKVSMDMTEACS